MYCVKSKSGCFVGSGSVFHERVGPVTGLNIQIQNSSKIKLSRKSDPDPGQLYPDPQPWCMEPYKALVTYGILGGGKRGGGW